MDRFIINGGRELHGEVHISGAKNAAASILPGTLLIDGPCTIKNIPDISDVRLTFDILEQLGASVRYDADGETVTDCSGIKSLEVPSRLGSGMRASHFFLGALLGRFGEAASPLPGGCDLGKRPIDQHLKGFEAMGAEVSIDEGYIRVSVPEGRRLHGTDITFDMVTVGATMNLMLAAALADGTTVLRNSAKEPHIVDLAGFINAMGGSVSGAGTDTVVIHGCSSLKGGEYSLIPDQIEAGTYMAAAAAAGGSVRICDVIPAHLECMSEVLRRMNAVITEGDDWIEVSRAGRLQAADIITMPYPGFPTDMQPQTGALMCLAEGKSTIVESVWSERFRYLDELCLMGAEASYDGDTAVISGKERLHGAKMRACDLRAGAAMIIAALAADGTSEISNIGLVERGYQDIAGKLAGIGADIEVLRD